MKKTSSVIEILRSPHLSEVRAATLRGQVVERIRLAILSGAVKPGERLNESPLANQFKISRIPVRETLMRLQEKGLVMNHPRRGMFVITLSEEGTQRINSLRIPLEAEAMKLCRVNLTSSDESRLDALVEKIENYSSSHTDFEASMLDLEFHSTIWACSANPYLEKTLNSLVAVLFSHQAFEYMTARGPAHWPLNHHGVLLEVISRDLEDQS